MLALMSESRVVVTLQLKPFLCLTCDGELGLTDGLRLYTCACMVIAKTQLQCVHCGAIRTWRPVGLGLRELQSAREQLTGRNGT